jgi:hypothetical protein
LHQVKVKQINEKPRQRDCDPGAENGIQ